MFQKVVYIDRIGWRWWHEVGIVVIVKILYYLCFTRFGVGFMAIELYYYKINIISKAIILFFSSIHSLNNIKMVCFYLFFELRIIKVALSFRKIDETNA